MKRKIIITLCTILPVAAAAAIVSEQTGRVLIRGPLFHFEIKEGIFL